MNQGQRRKYDDERSTRQSSMTWLSKGFVTFTHGELPTAPIKSLSVSHCLIRIATAKAAVVNVMFVNLKSYEGVKVRAEQEKGRGAPEARIYLTK